MQEPRRHNVRAARLIDHRRIEECIPDHRLAARSLDRNGRAVAMRSERLLVPLSACWSRGRGWPDARSPRRSASLPHTFSEARPRRDRRRSEETQGRRPAAHPAARRTTRHSQRLWPLRRSRRRDPATARSELWRERTARTRREPAGPSYSSAWSRRRLPAAPRSTHARPASSSSIGIAGRCPTPS